MHFLKHSGNSSLQDVLAETLRESYVLRGGASAFIVDQTNLFYDHEGTQFFPYKKQVHFMNLLRPQDRLVVVLKPRQCTPKDTYIYTPNGIFTIKELFDMNYSGDVYTYDEQGNLQIDQIIDIWESGEKEIYETKIWSGEKLNSSSKHKINTINKGFQLVEDLEKNEEIRVFEGQFNDVRSFSDEELIMMGYFITDGSYSSRNISFCNKNENYLNEFISVTTKLFNSVPKIDIMLRGKVIRFPQYLSENNIKVRGWFDKFDLKGIKGKERILPNEFLNLTKEETSILLNRIFAGDGWYSSNSKTKNGLTHTSNEIGIGSPSLKFLHQISFLLSKFGIHCNINQCKEYKEGHEFYKLRFSQVEYIEKFFNEIGIYDKQIRKEIKIINKKNKTLKRVKYVKNTSKKEMTYDLTTKKYHSYIANGIHCHNSGFSTAIVGRAVWEAYFGKVNEVVIVSASRTQAEKVIDRIKEAFYSMDESIRPTFKADNKQQLFLNNGVKIYSLASNPDTMRGFTGIAYIDEFAMISVKDSYEIHKALYPSTTKGGRLVYISTPKGKQGKFYDLATKSLSELSGRQVQNDRVLYRIEWKDVPHIVHAVEKEDLFAGMTPEDIDQEYGLLFTNDDEESLFTMDFLMSNFIERDDVINLFSTYDELGIPSELMNDWNEPLDPAFYIKNNRNFSDLVDRYERFVGGWDTAFANDDSFFIVMGVNRKTKQKEIIFEQDLKKISSNLITQAKYARRIIDFFGLENLSIDIKGVGNSVKDYYSIDDDLLEICNFYTYTSQNKVDNFLRLKDDINMGSIKRRYDGTKYDNYVLKQATNLFYKGGKIVGGNNGKDDYFNAVMLANESSKNTVGGGFFFV